MAEMADGMYGPLTAYSIAKFRWAQALRSQHPAWSEADFAYAKLKWEREHPYADFAYAIVSLGYSIDSATEYASLRWESRIHISQADLRAPAYDAYTHLQSAAEDIAEWSRQHPFSVFCVVYNLGHSAEIAARAAADVLGMEM